MRNRRSTDIFSLAFLDIIACGFGAIVLLLLIVKPQIPDRTSLVNSLSLDILFSLQDKKENFNLESDQLDRKIENARKLLASSQANENNILTEIQSVKQQKSMMEDIQDNLKTAQQSLTIEMQRILDSNIRDEEVGGIPVDSEYIIFIIDNSGSMEKPWKEVVSQLKNILDIHPTIKGIQVMNDQGAYLFNSYAGKGKWIPDTASHRAGILKKLQPRSNWRDQSASNPVKGISTALNNHFTPGKKISIYLMGDDLMSGAEDANIAKIDALNTDALSGNRKARIHGIVFAGMANQNLIAYTNFIRQLTLRNEGTALFIPINDHLGWNDCTPGVDCEFYNDR